MEGEMQLTTAEQSVTLTSGQMLALHEGIPHSVVATKETIFLLTLTARVVVAENFYKGKY